MIEEKPPCWLKKRNYLHFDRPISELSIINYVSLPKNIASHAFYPFISYKAISYKIRKTDTGIEKVFKDRPIAYASHIDSHIYSYYNYMLSHKYEDLLTKTDAKDSVLAFRKLDKCNIDFAFSAFQSIKKQQDCVAIALDIKGFFENLDHEILKKSWSSLLELDKLPDDHFAVFKSLTKYASVDKLKIYSTLGMSINNPKYNDFRICTSKDFREKIRPLNLVYVNNKGKGIPQGSPISALLSNIYMFDFDSWLFNIVKRVDGSYFRYCDDIMVIVPLEKEGDILSKIKNKIAFLKIEINDKKTEIRRFYVKDGSHTTDKPLQYLGFTFDGSKVILRSSSLSRFSMKMKGGVKLAKSTMRKRNVMRVTQGLEERPLFKKKLYGMYSYRGGRNFLSYGYRAAKTMDSNAIKSQLKPWWSRLQQEIKK